MNNFTKYTVLLAATSLCGINAANAVEKGKFYASGSYGVGFADKFDYKEPELLDVRKPSNANVFGAAVGYGVTDNIRAELSYNGFYGMKYKSVQNKKTEVNGVNQDIWSTKQSANAAFVSAFYDIKFNKLKNITPFIGAGIGISQNKSGDMNIKTQKFDKDGKLIDGPETVLASSSKKVINFAWHVNTGVNYTVNDKIDLNLVNYKYANLGKAKTLENENGILTNKLRVHSVSTGITFKF